MSKSAVHQPNTREIREDNWIPFLAEFTQENRGAHATLEMVGGDNDTGHYVETEDRPFEGISADVKDKERTVWIAFGATAEEHMTHSVHDVAAIRMLGPTETTGPVLEIESADGGKTLLQLSDAEAYELPPASR